MPAFLRMALESPEQAWKLARVIRAGNAGIPVLGGDLERKRYRLQVYRQYWLRPAR